jgi:uncharacterized repeat protein (TIGR01451 family)
MQSTGGVDRIFIAKFSFLPADLAVTKTGSPNPAIASQTITYMLNVANNGPGGASSVTLADNVPADTTFVSFSQSSGPAFSCSQPKIGGTGPITCTISLLSNGATAVFSLVVRVNPATPGGVTITNTATVSSAVPDPSAANNSATATTAVLPVSAIPTFSFVLLLLLGAVLAGSASIAMRW